LDIGIKIKDIEDVKTFLKKSFLGVTNEMSLGA